MPVRPLRHILTAKKPTRNHQIAVSLCVSFHTDGNVIHLIFQFNFDSFHLSRDFRSFIPVPHGNPGETSGDKYEKRILQFEKKEIRRVGWNGKWCAFGVRFPSEYRNSFVHTYIIVLRRWIDDSRYNKFIQRTPIVFSKPDRKLWRSARMSHVVCSTHNWCTCDVTTAIIQLLWRAGELEIWLSNRNNNNNRNNNEYIKSFEAIETHMFHASLW